MIAKNGFRFTDESTPSAICTPTRYNIKTGSNSYHYRLPWGVWDCFDESGVVAPSQYTVANVMKDAGKKKLQNHAWGYIPESIIGSMWMGCNKNKRDIFEK